MHAFAPMVHVQKFFITGLFFLAGTAYSQESIPAAGRGRNLSFCSDLLDGSKNNLELARTMVAFNKRRFDQVFETTGFQNYAEFDAYVLKNKGKIGKKLVDMVFNGELEISMRAPYRARMGIMTNGFQNFRATGTSGGFQFLEERNLAESVLLGMELDDYVKTSHEFKPKYGYFRPGKAFSKTEDLLGDTVAKYGEDIYVFRRSRVSDRVTWTVSDSLGKPEGRDWSTGYIPLEYSGLIIPFLERRLRAEEFQISDFDKELFPQLRDGAYTSPSRYTEIQFWGPLKLVDVEKFIFTRRPPENGFLKELLEKGIEIYDARENPATGWATPTRWKPKDRLDKKF